MSVGGSAFTTTFRAGFSIILWINVHHNINPTFLTLHVDNCSVFIVDNKQKKGFKYGEHNFCTLI